MEKSIPALSFSVERARRDVRAGTFVHEPTISQDDQIRGVALMRGSTRFIVVALSACIIPACVAPAAIAQVGRFGRGGVPKGPAREPGIEIPSQVNMINLLIERRQEVALSDSQFMGVIALKRELDSTNAPHMRTLDSISRLFRKGQFLFSQPSREHNDSLARARLTVREVSAAVVDNNATARDRAYVLLTPTQLSKARAIQSKAEQAAIAAATAKKP